MGQIKVITSALVVESAIKIQLTYGNSIELGFPQPKLCSVNGLPLPVLVWQSWYSLVGLPGLDSKI